MRAQCLLPSGLVRLGFVHAAYNSKDGTNEIILQILSYVYVALEKVWLFSATWFLKEHFERKRGKTREAQMRFNIVL